MTHLELTTKDKIILGLIVVGEVVSYQYGSPLITGILGAVLLGLFTINKLFDAILDINKTTRSILNNHTTFRAAFTTASIPDPASNTQYHVESIERLLSAIRYDATRTLFDFVVESSTNSTLVANLVKTQDLLLESLSTLSLQNAEIEK